MTLVMGSRLRRSLAVVAVFGCLAWLMLSVTAPTPAAACSCDSLPLADYADRVTLAFTGTVVDIAAADPEAHVDVTFAVRAVHRGSAAETITLGTSGDTCGLASQLVAQGDGLVGIVAFGPDDPPVLGGCGSVVPPDELAAVFGPGQAMAGAEPPDASQSGPGNRWWWLAAPAVVASAVGAAVVAIAARRRPAGGG